MALMGRSDQQHRAAVRATPDGPNGLYRASDGARTVPEIDVRGVREDRHAGRPHRLGARRSPRPASRRIGSESTLARSSGSGCQLRAADGDLSGSIGPHRSPGRGGRQLPAAADRRLCERGARARRHGRGRTPPTSGSSSRIRVRRSAPGSGEPAYWTGRDRLDQPILDPDAPEGMPDPHLSPPQMARVGDPFAWLRIVEFVGAHVRATRPTSCATWWRPSTPPTSTGTSPRRSCSPSWCSSSPTGRISYHGEDRIVLGDNERGHTLLIVDSTKMTPFLVSQATRLREACDEELRRFALGDGVTTDN